LFVRIKKGTTLAELLDWCSHAFFYDLNFDKPLPANGPDLTHEIERLERARQSLAEVRAMTVADARLQERAEREKSNRENVKWNRKKRENIKILRDLIRQTQAWDAPASCQPVKDFMLEQLESEVKHEDHTWDRRKFQPPKKWLADRLKWATEDVARPEESLADARKGKESTQQFVASVYAEMQKLRVQQP
jgi:hypothetical protein